MTQRTPTSWGRYPAATPVGTVALTPLFSMKETSAPYLVRGLGRSYGDVAMPSQGTMIDGTAMGSIIAFDDAKGILHCQAGCTLETILEHVMPRGWTLPVVPGTRFVTVGGAIANDIHGKNHHRQGTFGCHVISFVLLRSGGQQMRCSIDTHPELFCATIGGLGLTGIITEVELLLMRVESSVMETTSIKTFDLSETLEVLQRVDHEWDYTVAWIDLLCTIRHRGRGLVSCGRHAALTTPDDSRPLFTPPRLGSLVKFAAPFLRPSFVRWGNRLRYGLQRPQVVNATMKYHAFFHPLDGVGRWNEAYGTAGFLQYQCVVPVEGGEQILTMLFDLLHQHNVPVYLAVLKIFGDRPSPGMLSFPRAGYTVALDIPFQGSETLLALDACDQLVHSVGGRVYPAKDARMSASMFRAMYPELKTFVPWKDPLMSSRFWNRIQGDQL